MRGANDPTKRQLLDVWASRYKVKVVALQETKINSNCCMESEHYVWYFSSNVSAESLAKLNKMKDANESIDTYTKLNAQEQLGVGFMVHKSLRIGIENVIAVSNRLIVLQMRAATQVYFYSAYAPTADAADSVKDSFYSMLAENWNHVGNEQFKLLMGDFNARLGRDSDDFSGSFGRHILTATEGEFANMSNAVWDNRRRFLDFIVEQGLWIANTHFTKHVEQLVTYKPPGTKYGVHAVEFGSYFQVDYIGMHARWKNTCKNIESDMYAVTNSDHYPVWIDLVLNFKVAKKSDSCNRQQWDLQVKDEDVVAFNKIFEDCVGDFDLGGHEGHTCLDHAFGVAAQECLWSKERKVRKPWISQQTFELIKEKHWLEQEGRGLEYRNKCVQARSASKKDWQNWLQDMTHSSLDLRDKWLGIKYLKERHSPKLYERATVEGKLAGFRKQADAAADYLEKHQWGDCGAGSSPSAPSRTKCQNKKNVCFDGLPFSYDELVSMIKKLKRHKAAGPDDIPIEFFKWLDEPNVNRVLNLINFWWASGAFPADKLKAHVASLYKKGDPKKQENYRPISLLNSIYKLYAGLLQVRIAAAIDSDLQKTQYGFRKNRSTSVPVACVKRVLERAEATHNPLFLVFLDWEKAFDRIKQDKLMEALSRMGFPPCYINAIQSLYNNPTFCVKIGEFESTWRTQHRGIRQGCPLSPYLFIILMTVMFRDIHDELDLRRGRLEGLDFSELLYADDTALITNNVNAMNRFLGKIEVHAAYYGLNFNKTKCVSFNFNTHAKPVFADRTRVSEASETQYLGSCISKHHDLRKEVNKKISACFATLQRLNEFWLRSSCPQDFKLNVFDAIIRSKLVYGLETVHLPKFLSQKLDTLQLKGLRKILKLDTTFINRANTNKSVYEKASAVKNPKGIEGKNVLPFSTYLKQRRHALLKHTIRAPNDDPLRQCSFVASTAVPFMHTNRRVGRPRGKWADDSMEEIYVEKGLGTSHMFRSNVPRECGRLESHIRARVI